ncbi:hypothetical protein CTAYLR_006985 [Chrysophaeum taylorii]|uniref:Uncharacterized protein n=1 Tax=Chrysophaeum taylorii TaxID=2483200 RepID=A0AAD7UBG6_9STRA|nr:hypothetical protein CTAYLR_006985 [Chrysophaeum taylorii]
MGAVDSWAKLILQRREEIERDTRALTEAKERRARALYDENAAPEEDEVVVMDGRRVDLSRRGLASCSVPPSIDALRLRTIQSLILRGNRIRTIDAHAIAKLEGLQMLDVSENLLERLGPFSPLVPFVPRILLARRNKISRLSVGCAPSLEKLDVSRNRIRFVSPDLNLAALIELDARHNDIDTHNLKSLANLRNLKCLLLLPGNPLALDPRHKLKLFAHAPHLRDALGAPRLVFLGAPPHL